MRSEGTPHTPWGPHLFCGGRVPGLALGDQCLDGAPRDRSCARRERWGQLGFRAVARRELGCRRSYARSGPIPLLCGRWWGSAGSVLRSQGTLGPAGLSRCRARGTRVSTFQCSLWTDPAPLGVLVGSAGSVLRSQGTLGPVGLSRFRARGIRVSTFLCSLRPVPAAASWIGGMSRMALT